MSKDLDAKLEIKPLPWFEILDTVFRRKAWILTFGAIGVIVAILQIAMEPPRYKATTRIQLSAKAESGPREAAMSDQQILAELALIQSSELIREVLIEARSEEDDAAGILHEPGLVGSASETLKKAWARLRRGHPPDPLELQIASIANRISADRLSGSNLVEVSYESRDPQNAADFVNRLLRTHFKRIGELNIEGSARPLYQEESKQAFERWQKAREALEDFSEEYGVDLLAGDRTASRNVLANLTNQLAAAETEVLQLKARSEFLAEQLESQPRTVEAEWTETEDESVRVLRQRVLDLEIQRSEALSKYTETSTIVRDLDRQLQETNKLLLAKEGQTLSEMTTTIDPGYQALQVDIVQTEAQLTAARARVIALREQTANYRTKLLKLEESSGDLEELQSAVDTAFELYQKYSGQEEQARIMSELGQSGFVNVAVLEKAVPPSAALPREYGRILALWLFLGVLLGTVCAFSTDILDPTIKNAPQAARISELRVIGQISGS